MFVAAALPRDAAWRRSAAPRLTWPRQKGPPSSDARLQPEADPPLAEKPSRYKLRASISPYSPGGKN